MWDWESYVESRGGAREGQEHLLVCPKCGKRKLSVNPHKEAWRCFVCGRGGRDPAGLIVWLEGRPWREALEEVRQGRRPVGPTDVLALSLKAPAPALRVPKEIPWPALWGPLVGDQGYSYCAGYAYCVYRGILPEVMSAMRLGYCSGGRFVGRVIFPCFDFGGRQIFYQGRATWNPRPGVTTHIKTLSVKHEDGHAGAAECVLNLSYVRERFLSVLLVEGPVDCAHAWPDAVATWGKKISDRQVELLLQAGVRAVDLCWDSDAVAAMEAAAPRLADVFRVRIVYLPPGTDPGNLTKEQIEYYRARAVTWGSGERLMRVPGI